MSARNNWPSKLPFLQLNREDIGAPPAIDPESGKSGWLCKDGSVVPYGTDPRLAEFEAEQREIAEQISSALTLLDSIRKAILDPENLDPFPWLYIQNRPEFIEWLEDRSIRCGLTSIERAVLYPAYASRKRKIMEGARRRGDAVSSQAINSQVGLQQESAIASNGRPERKPESQKKYSNPTSEVINCAAYINRQDREADKKRKKLQPIISLCREFLEDKNISAKPESFAKHFQPSKHRQLLERCQSFENPD